MLWGSWSRTQTHRKRIKVKDAKVIATAAVSRSVTTTDAKAVGTANNKVNTIVNNSNMQMQQLPLDRSIRSQGQSSTNVGPAAESSTESGGEYTHHYRYFSSAINMVSDLIREREPNMEVDGCKMPEFTFSGSDASDNYQLSDQSEEHKTTKECKAMDQTQNILSTMDD